MKNLFLFLVLSLVLNISQGQISFSPYTTVAEPEVRHVNIADINHDGLQDVILCIDDSPKHQVKIWPQNQATPIIINYPGHFQGASAMKTIDINNDSWADIIITTGDSILIYKNNAGILSLDKKIYSGQMICDLDVGDLNNDGLMDIVCSHWQVSFIKIFYQGTSNSFTANTKPINYYGKSRILIGDVTGNNLNDLVFVKCNGLDSNIIIYSDLGQTLLANDTFINNAVKPEAIAIGKLGTNNYRSLSMAYGGNKPNSKIAVWDNNFSNVSSYACYDIPGPLIIEDLNGDNINEIIVAHSGWGKVSVFNTSSMDTQMFAVPFAGGSYGHYGMAVGDINGDGKKDVVIADRNHGVVMLINKSSMASIEPSNHPGFFMAYPNPIHNTCTISLGENPGEVRVRIFSLTKSLLLEKTFYNERELSLDCSKLTPSVYIMEILGKNFAKTDTIIKI